MKKNKNKEKKRTKEQQKKTVKEIKS